jgi:hypothetical protein
VKFKFKFKVGDRVRSRSAREPKRHVCGIVVALYLDEVSPYEVKWEDSEWNDYCYAHELELVENGVELFMECV